MISVQIQLFRCTLINLELDIKEEAERKAYVFLF